MWTQAAIGEVGQVYTGSTPPTSEQHYFGGDIPFVTPADLDKPGPVVFTPRTLTEAGAAETRLLPEGAVMVCCIGSLGKMGIAGRSLATNQQINSIVFDQRRVLPCYGLHAVRQLKEKLVSMAPATTVAIVSKSKFEALKISIPPLDEQRRIAAILDQADDLRRKRRAALSRIGQLGQSELFNLLSSTDCTPQRLRDICHKITDGTHQAPKWVPSGIPFIFVSNIRNQIISLQTNKFVSEAAYAELTRRTSIEIDDVLYTAVGSYGNAGRVVTTERFIFQRHVAHLKPNRAVLDGTFLSYVLESPDLRRQADKTATGLAQKTVTLEELKSFSIPVPAIDFQRAFAARIAEIDAFKAHHCAHLVKLDVLFASLQHRAFRGEL